jgi:hypothetical protein
MLLLLCCALNREYTMRQPLKHSCHKDLEKVSGSEAEGKGADFTGTVNPVAVQLTIGDDAGFTTVNAELH